MNMWGYKNLSIIKDFQLNFDKQAMMRCKRSPVWGYFDLVYEGEKKFGSCKVCRKKINSGTRKSYTTSSLANHLMRKHPEVFQEFKQKQQNRKDLASESKVASKNMNEVDLNSHLTLLSSPQITQTKSFEPSSPEEKDTNHFEKIVLAGDDFGNDLMYFFKELANDEDFTNVTLVTDGGRTIKAHKVVLSAFSPFFKLDDVTYDQPLTV